MNRRKFFSAVMGFSSGFGVVAALRSCYTPRTQFPPEEILEIDEEGIVHDYTDPFAEVPEHWIQDFDDPVLPPQKMVEILEDGVMVWRGW